MRFKLRITAGKGKGREFVFRAKSISIGRQPDNDLVLYDSGVSRAHCAIVREADAFVLRDTGSANGTYVNGELATESHIFDGDEISVGPVTFEFSAREVTEVEDAEAVDRVVAWKAKDEAERRMYEEMDTKAYDLSQSGEVCVADDDGNVVDGPQLTDTGSYKPRKKKYKPRPIAVGIGAALVVAGAVISWLMLVPRIPTDRSGEVFTISETNSALRFGAGKVDVFTPSIANFAFDYTGGQATLVYAVGSTQTDDEVLITLNGRPIGHAPASPEKWTTDVAIDLPSDLLNRGRNVVSFRHKTLAGSEPRWGIAQLRVVESEVPEVDVARAERLFELGKASFDTRTVAPQNLARAVAYFHQARLFLEALPEKPPLYYDIQKSLTRAESELQNVFDTHLFAAEQALRFGDRARAIQSLRDALHYFPDRADPRHATAKQRLDDLLSNGD